jgi:hypothetical protein
MGDTAPRETGGRPYFWGDKGNRNPASGVGSGLSG